LALGREEGSKLVGKGGGNDGTNNASVGGANPDGSEFGGVVRVFVQSEKAVGAKVRGDGCWHFIVENELADAEESGKVGGGNRVIVGGREGLEEGV
jgi:hypothetical protein